jgi:RNA polymerase sigma factor (sigma-70 family)
MLVREGYEAAFEEIVRRYGRPLGRYAASIVGGHSEDVLQDAFAKALPALRRDDAEVDLRPWLFRIVRNTALNDLRDSPPSPEALAETLAGGRNPAEELEAREQLADLMRRLQALPEAQRAAIVMRELEGLGHEEIAAALGLSDGGARQAIYRARRALRDSAGMLLPLPLLRLLIDHGTEAAGASAGAGGALAAAGASAGGAGAGGALKAGVVAVVVAGSVGAGVAVQEHRAGNADTAKASGAALRPAPPAGSSPASPTGLALAAQRVGGSHSGDDRHGEGRDAPGSTGKDSSGHERNGAADDDRGPHGRRPPHRGGDDPDEHRGIRSEDEHGEQARAPRPEQHGGDSGPDRHGDDGAIEDRHGDDDHSGPGGGGDDGELGSGSGPGPSHEDPPSSAEEPSLESNERPEDDETDRDPVD